MQHLWFIAGAATMAGVLLAPRLARRHRKGIDVQSREWLGSCETRP